MTKTPILLAWMALFYMSHHTPVHAELSIPFPSTSHPSGLEIMEHFPHEEAFTRRAEQIVANLAKEDLGKWRRGYFKGGDPGKYLPTAAMARLMVDPKDPQALDLMNDDRSPKEHYHFAALNWARFLPLFGQHLRPQTMDLLKKHGFKHDAYLGGGGTENHKIMWYANSLVVSEHLDHGLGHSSRETVLKKMTEWLRGYVRNLYHFGMGEWESATYHMFCVHSMLNLYDFSSDPDVRLLAAAALDYYVSSYALKYNDGLLSGPSQRGYATKAAGKISDQSGWLWWGSSASISDKRAGGFRYAIHPATSSWRPNCVLCDLALKTLPTFPFLSRNTKPNYWFGLGIEPQAGVTQETYWVTEHLTLGSLAEGYDPYGQTVRWQLSAKGGAEPKTLTGGHPFDHRRRDGLGKYDRTLQVDGTLVLVADLPTRASLLPAAEKAFEVALEKGDIERVLTSNPEMGGHPELSYKAHTVTEQQRQSWIDEKIQAELAKCPQEVFVALPDNNAPPVELGGWWFLSMNDVYVGLKALGGEAELGSLAPSPRSSKRAQKKGGLALPEPVWLVRGQKPGFILHTGDRTTHRSLSKFAKSVMDHASHLQIEQGGTVVNGKSLTGKAFSFTLVPDENLPLATIEGSPHLKGYDAIFENPYHQLKEGVLTLNNGQKGYIVDFSGAMPVYRAWKP